MSDYESTLRDVRIDRIESHWPTIDNAYACEDCRRLFDPSESAKLVGDGHRHGHAASFDRCPFCSSSAVYPYREEDRRNRLGIVVSSGNVVGAGAGEGRGTAYGIVKVAKRSEMATMVSSLD